MVMCKISSGMHSIYGGESSEGVDRMKRLCLPIAWVRVQDDIRMDMYIIS